MTTVRVLVEDDVPAVAALFARVYPQYRWSSQDACESYFREILFDHPWRELDLPSWVAEERGRICAGYVVLPRPMLFHGRRIRAAVGCQLMVDPDHRHSLAVLQLAKACLSGPQDLTLADGANDLGRRAWSGIGGTVPLLYSLHWTRPLRPARYLLSLLEARAALAPALAVAARPMGAAVDAFASRIPSNRFFRERDSLVEEALGPDSMLEHLPEVLRGYALQPAYDARSLGWLLAQAARKRRHGTLRTRLVRDAKRGFLGWYLYYLRAGAAGEVLQIAAQKRSFDAVLRCLLADAWRQGATALRGRLEPRFMQELSARHCWLRVDGTWTVVHSRRPEILAAFERGDAFLSRLDGEWMLHFLDG